MDMRIPRPFRGVVLCATGISDKVRSTEWLVFNHMQN